jgi:hypothetical protein
MSDDVTLGEVARRIDALSVQVTQLVSRSEYEVRLAAITKDIADVEARLTVAESRRWQAGLAIVTSVLFPLVLLYLQSGG